MGAVHLGCVVEGHGEVQAVPVLVRRIASLIDPSLTVLLPTPIRTPRDRLLKPGELERAVDLAARKSGRSGAVLVLVDAHDDCPATLGPELLKRASKARSDRLIAVVLAKPEYESWFLASAASLQGQRGLQGDLQTPPDVESIQGAKEWLSKRMTPGRKYSETLDQPALSALFDLDAARQHSASFDKCHRELTRILTTLANASETP